MPRDFQINGETLVQVKFGAHLPASVSNITGSTSNLSELGLAAEAITIAPQFSHMDIRADDFGYNVPAEVLSMIAEVNIRMTLVHYDRDILDLCLAESLGGTLLGTQFPNGIAFAGTLAPAGTPLAGQSAYLASGYHYISLSLLSPQLDYAYHFPTAFLAGPAMEYPVGTDRSLTRLNWRALPLSNTNATGEIYSSGAILWDHNPDLT